MVSKLKLLYVRTDQRVYMHQDTAVDQCVCMSNLFHLWSPFLINVLKNDEDTHSQMIISCLASEVVEWTDLRHQRSSHTVNTHEAAVFSSQC